MQPRTSILAFALSIVVSTAWAQAVPAPHLDVDVRDGHITVTAEQTDLSDKALKAVQARVATALERSPLREHATLHMSVRGERLAELSSRLNRIDLDDPRAVQSAIDAVSELQFKPHDDRRLTEPVEVVLGRQFHISADNAGGSVVAIGATGEIDAPIADVVAIGSHVRLGPHAIITQRIASVGSDIERAPGAQVTGQEFGISLPSVEQWARDNAGATQAAAPRALGPRIAGSIIGCLLSLGFGLLCGRLAPRASARVVARLHRRPWRCFGFGLLHYFAILPAAALLVLSILGIPLLPAYFFSLGLILWTSYVAGAALLGTTIARAWRAWQRLALGLVLLSAASWVPVAGGMLVFAATTSGFGAVMQALYRRARKPPRPRRTIATTTAPPSGAALPQHG